MNFDEILLGRVIAAKRNGTDILPQDCNKNVKTQSTVLPDILCESYFDWLNNIKQDMLLIEKTRQQNEQNKLLMNNNLLSHYDWLQTKFKLN